jgi:hypothetical protein
MRVTSFSLAEEIHEDIEEKENRSARGLAAGQG